MKIIAIGDIHGRSIWKDIVSKETDADKIVFVGDYFDSRSGHSGNRQIENFKEIIEFKKANKDKVILCVGNHDFHYIRGIGETYSGYQASYAIDIGEVIQQALNEDLIQICFVSDKFIFTHAGITKTWANINTVDVNNLEQSINDLFKFKPNCFKFTMGNNYSSTGRDITQTPIWVRPEALVTDMLDEVISGNLYYIVGHTPVNYIGVNIIDNIIMIDALGTSEEYLTIIDGVPTVSKVIKIDV